MVFQNLGPLKELVLPRGMTSSKLRYITYTIGNAVRGVRTRFPHPRDHPRRVDKKLVQNDIIKNWKKLEIFHFCNSTLFEYKKNRPVVNNYLRIFHFKPQ